MNKDLKLYNILVIEDNPGDFALIEDYILDYISYPNIVNATSFGEARSLAAEDTVKFDLIMLDLTLSDKKGAELIEGIVEIFPDYPIIVLTGYTDFEFSVKSLSLGVSDYLLKDELSASSLYKSIIYNIERKKTLIDLEESEKRYGNLFHLSPEPMWVYDVETLRFLDVNAAAIEQYGYSLEEFLSMTIEKIRPEEDVAILNEAIQQARNKPNILFQDRFRHQKKSGETILVEIQSSIFEYRGREAKIILAHNATERINYINAIEDQNKKLSEISWIQSHIVRAPIARLMGLIDLIKSPDSSEELKTEMLDYVLQSAHELDGIVKKITTKAEAYNQEYKEY